MHETLDHLGDEDVAREALNNKEAFAALVTRYQDRLDRYMRRLGMGRREDREDVLQNVFLKVYRNLNGFDTRLRFSSWIYRIAHNETMSFFRSRKARPEAPPDEGDDILERIPAVLDIEGDANIMLDAVRVRRALDTLDPKYRDVLVLRFFEDRAYNEMSDILRVPMGTVATLLNRAKKKLHDAMTSTN
jgi:RNA polymerase sigma-70 factor (ECF subfamily)